MTKVAIVLPNDLLERLQELASRHQITTEAPVKASLEAFVAVPDASFLAVVDHILDKPEICTNVWRNRCWRN